jgi:hypothetical protein
MKMEKKRKWQNALAFLLVSLQSTLSSYDHLTSLSVQINSRQETQSGHPMAKVLSYTTRINFAARLRWKMKNWRPHKALNRLLMLSTSCNLLLNYNNRACPIQNNKTRLKLRDNTRFEVQGSTHPGLPIVTAKVPQHKTMPYICIPCFAAPFFVYL